MPLPVTRLLRGTRASPPGMAAGDVERRHVYGAALQQAEDLFEAAAAVGPLARPLPLFYAVSQAGRAITAAWLEDGWQTKGHGIGQVGGDAVWEAREHPALPGEAVGEWSVRSDCCGDCCWSADRGCRARSPLVGHVLSSGVWGSVAIPRSGMVTRPRRGADPPGLWMSCVPSAGTRRSCSGGRPPTRRSAR
jgi:hypothetical protein